MGLLRALFLGPPGAGKGTLINRLVRDIPNLSTIASGDVLRTNIANRTKIGLDAESYIKKGQLVPDTVMIGLITGLMEKEGYLTNSSWILDGFPRTVAQAPALDRVLEKDESPLNAVIWLNVPDKVILDRIENRWVHIPSGRIYNLTYNPPKVAGKDDITGEPLTKRPDDRVDVFEKRLEHYWKETFPLVEYYRNKGVLKEFRGETSDSIYPHLLSFISSKIREDTTAETNTTNPTTAE